MTLAVKVALNPNTTNQPTNQSTNQPTNEHNQPTNQPIQPTNQPTFLRVVKNWDCVVELSI